MMKAFFRILFLGISLTLLAYVGSVVYHKQYFPISHSSFRMEEAEQYFIPDIKSLCSKENALELLSSYGAGNWKDWLYLFCEYDHSEVQISVQISQSSNQSILSIKGLSEDFLTGRPELSISHDGQTIMFNEETFFIWKNGTYLALSNRTITPRIVKKQPDKMSGNADFFYEGRDGIVESIKLTDDVKYSAYSISEKIVKGRPVNPLYLLSNCPASADLVQYYASTRFADDAPTLYDVAEVDYTSWVDNEIVYLRKDSFEVVAGKQNDGQTVKNLILEAAMELAEDSLQKPSIYFNNTEIIPFSIPWSWTTLCADLQSDMHYLASYNDIVFLGNNLQSIYWILTNIQLGQTFNTFELRKKIPSRVNNLSIRKSTDGIAITSKTWVRPDLSINLSAMSNHIIRSNEERLIAGFDYVEPANWLLTAEDTNGLKVILADKEKITCFNALGEELWQVAPDQAIGKAELIDIDGSKGLLIVTENKVNIFDLAGESIYHFEADLPARIEEVVCIQGKDALSLLIKQKGVMSLFNHKGQKIPLSSSLKKRSGINILSPLQGQGNSFMLSDVKSDSIFLLDAQTGKVQSYQLKISAKTMAPFINSNFDSGHVANLLSYENSHIKMQYLNDTGKDSIRIKIGTGQLASHWTKIRGDWFLAIEYFNRVLFLNKLGINELELSKPEPNLIFLSGNWTNFSVFVFLNKETRKVFLVDAYGNLLLKKPIGYEGLLAITDKHLVNKSQNKIHVYKID